MAKTPLFYFVIIFITFFFDYTSSVINVINTDYNITVAHFNNIDSRYGNSFLNGEKAYLFESKPLLACNSTIEPPFLSIPNYTDIRFVVLIKRGNCTFRHKIHTAQESGYMGVIIFNNEIGDLSQMDVGDEILPSCMVSLKTGKLLQSEYTFTKSRQNFLLVFYENSNLNFQIYIISFLGFVSVGFFIVGVGFGIKLCYDARKRWANRLRKCHLKKIPIKKFVKGQDPYETCAICLEDFKDGDKLRILPCNHAYHCICIDPWLLKQKRNCPICKCRIKIPGRDEDSDSIDSPTPQNRHFIPDEQTPLINSRIPNVPNYINNNEPGVNVIPEQFNHPTTVNCYENMSFDIDESKPETSNDIKSSLPINIDHSINSVQVDVANDGKISDLTKIV